MSCLVAACKYCEGIALGQLIAEPDDERSFAGSAYGDVADADNGGGGIVFFQ